MIPLLPVFKQNKRIYLHANSFPVKNNFRAFEKLWSFTTASLGTVCLLLIFAITYTPVQKVISPIVSTLSKLSPFGIVKSQDEVFTFAPASSYNKLDKIAYKGLTTLAYYDLPVDTDGMLVYDSDGYMTLKTQEAKDLFSTAHAHGTKVVLTLSQTYNNDIKAILENPASQQTFIGEAVREVKEAEVDGVTLDFEFKGPAGSRYRSLFTNFVENFTRQMHEQVSDSQVSVALPDSLPADSLYDVPALAKSVNKVFVMAYSFAVPETDGEKLIAPVSGYDSEDYMKNMDERMKAFREQVPSDKLAIERAWYGNGNNYPFYHSDSVLSLGGSENHNTLITPLSPSVINRLVRDLPSASREAARQNLPLIAKALEKEHILNPNVLAYAIATIEHETAETFAPIEEFKGRKSARRLGYECGTNYYGRGFVQLTHCRNYKKMGERIGMGDALVRNPELASKPEISAAILAAFFVDNNVSYWATQGDFVTARIPINPDRQGNWIAILAWKYLEEIV